MGEKKQKQKKETNTHNRRTRQTATQTRMLPTTVPTMMNNKTALMRIVTVRLYPADDDDDDMVEASSNLFAK